MTQHFTKSRFSPGRLALGSFLAASLGAAIAFPALSAAGAATLGHRAGSAARHPVTRLVPRPHGKAARVLAGNLINHGGPVQTAPKVYIDFWGWTSDPSGEKAYLTNFLSSIGGTSWLSTVNQYGAGSSGNLLAGTWSHAATVPLHPTDTAIQRQAARTAAHFSAGTSDNVQIVVATPTGHNSSGFGTQYCAYHGTVSADPNITYTNLPYMTDAGANCGEDSVNGSSGTLDGVSIVEGHELAETITDPLLNAWFDASGQEIGDKCAWINLQDITTSGGTFAMQPLWSNAASGCVQ
jgi:serine protease